MNVVAFKSREFAARIGAVVVAFVLAFSLVSLTAPARADGELDMKMWLEYSFSGDNVTFSYRYHSTMQGSDHKTMCNKYGNSGAYDGALKYGITQYEGVEVCEMQATIKIDQFVSSNGTAIGFGTDDKLYREGSNIVYEGDLSVFSDATSAQFIDYKITFAGGVVSAEGAEVSGNTAKLKLGGKFKVVGNPGSGSSNGGSTNGGSSNGGSNNGGSSGNNQGGASPSATPSANPSITPGSDNNENTVANGAPATATPTPLAVKSSKSSSDNTLLYVIIGVTAVALVGLGAFLALRSGKKKPPSGMGGQFAYAPQSYGPGSYPQQQYPPQGNYPQQGQYGGYNG